MDAPISRVRRSKEQAKVTYNKLSRWYDLIAGRAEKKYREVGLEMLDAQKGEYILEIGYGTGHCLLTLAQAVGATGQVSGIDLSEGMHAIAAERIEKAGLSAQTDLHVGDALNLPFGPAEFDGVFMSFTLELFDTPEIPLVLQQCVQVLRAQGRIVVVSLIKTKGTAVRIYEWFHDKMPNAVDCRPIYAQPVLTEAGFTIHETRAMSMWGLPVEIILARKNNQIR